MKRILKYFYIFFILCLLYTPILILIVLSFNNSKSRTSWGGFTLNWYRELFYNEQIIEAFFTTISLGLLSAFIATILGSFACLGLKNFKKRTRTLIWGSINIPILNAEIVTGISLMLLFIALRLTPNFLTVLLSHITINVPYVILSILPKIRRLNPNIFEAALDLGASEGYAFRKVILPEIFPGIISGFLLSFTMSLDDFVVTYFTKGPGFDTLSTEIYTQLRRGVKPEMYALSTLMFIVVLIVLLIINFKPKRKWRVGYEK